MPSRHSKNAGNLSSLSPHDVHVITILLSLLNTEINGYRKEIEDFIPIRRHMVIPLVQFLHASPQILRLISTPKHMPLQCPSFLFPNEHNGIQNVSTLISFSINISPFPPPPPPPASFWSLCAELDTCDRGCGQSVREDILSRGDTGLPLAEDSRDQKAYRRL